MSLISQTVLKKVVISNGGQSIANNLYQVNLSIGQSLSTKTKNENSEACIGFWYEKKVLTPTSFKLEKYNSPEKVVIKKNAKGSDLKIYPNPVFGKTQIRFLLAEKGKARLSMIDIQGREVDVLLYDHLEDGEYKLTYYPKSAMSGVYTLMLCTEKERLHQSCIIMN